MPMLRCLTLGLLFGASAAAQPMAVEDDCTVRYREDLVSTAEVSSGVLTPSIVDHIADLERRYAERPNSRGAGAELAEAYAVAGRQDESVELLSALSAHRRARPEDYAHLLRAQTLIGRSEDAAATIERFGRRFRRQRTGRAWREAVQFHRAVSASVETAEEILSFPLPPASCVELAADFALGNGDVVGGLVLTEALYYGAGFAAVSKNLVDPTALVYRELLSAVAKGDGWPFAVYAPGTARAAFAASLVAAAREVCYSLADYPSTLELYADIRVRAQRRYAEAARASDEGLVEAVMAVADRIAADGQLRWISMARLRELDRGYFDAVTCQESTGWKAVRAYVESGQVRAGGDVFAALKSVAQASERGVGE